MRRVLLVDDQPLFRRALATLLTNANWEVVGEAEDGEQGIKMTRELNPDLVLMDIRMPRLNGLDATRAIKALRPETKVVILTVSDEDSDLFEALKLGANGYLLKNVRPELFFELLAGVFAGEVALTPGIATRILEEFRAMTRKTASPRAAELTRREQEILRLVAQGASNKEIAAALHIAEGTVKNHLHNILEKLHIKSRSQAIAKALREGLIPPAETG